MAGSPKNNPITIRLERLQSEYFNFRDNENARLCRWLVEADEVDMIDAFVRVENANEARTDDIFIRFRAPFEKPEAYGAALSAELEEVWQTYQEHLSQHKTAQYPSPIKVAPNPAGFLQKLESFCLQWPDFEGLVVAVLSPDETASPGALQQWLEKAITAGIPPRVRLMVVDLIKSPFLEGIAQAFPREVQTIQPDLDMPAAMRQIAATGDPKNPGVQYRKLFVELTQHVSKGNLEAMNRVGESALAIAAREQWMYLEVATYLAMASGYIGKSQTDQAITIYNKAKQTAQTAWEAGDPVGGKLLIQTLLGRGSLQFGEKDYPAAVASYREAVAPAVALADDMSLLEAWRMAGFSHEMNKQYRDAWDCNEQALEAGGKLDEQLRPSTTLPYVGQALLRLSPQLGFHEKDKTVRQQMTTLCGENWEKQLSNKGGKS